MTHPRAGAITLAVAGALALPPAAVLNAQTQQPTKAPSAETPSARRAVAQGFSVILVIADLQGAAGEDDVPPAARRALADMKDFLPYKSYKLLDAAWIMGSARAVSRLRGPEDREYELEIVSSSGGSTRGPAKTSRETAESGLLVQFSLREADGRDEVAAMREGVRANSQAVLAQQLHEAEAEAKAARDRLGANHPDVQRAERRVADIRDRMAAESRESARGNRVDVRPKFGTRSVMNTSFTMDVGETVVVGTSRLKGNNRALIALLTAVPPRGTRTTR